MSQPVPPFQFSQRAAIIHDGCLLAQQKSDAATDCAGQWELPGGRIEFGEDLDAGFMREIREETGLDIQPGAVFHLYSIMSPYADPVTQVVVAIRHATCADVSTLCMDNHAENDNIAQIKWVPVAEALQLNWIRNMREAVTMFLDTSLLQAQKAVA